MRQLYARVFTQILDSSLAENWQTRHVFEDMLKLADDGVCDMTRQAIARRTNVPLEIVNSAIAELEAPDPESRDDSEQGRRLLRLDAHRDWGWKIVNWEKYESVKSGLDQREKTRERVRSFRERNRQPLPLGTPTQTDSEAETDAPLQKRYQALHSVTDRYTALQGVTSEPKSLELFTETVAKEAGDSVETPKHPKTAATGQRGAVEAIPAELDTPEFRQAWELWKAHRKSKRQPLTPQTAKLQLGKLLAMGLTRAIATIEHSAGNGWTGLFEPQHETNRKPGSWVSKRTANTLANDPEARKQNDYDAAAPALQ